MFHTRFIQGQLSKREKTPTHTHTHKNNRGFLFFYCSLYGGDQEALMSSILKSLNEAQCLYFNITCTRNRLSQKILKRTRDYFIPCHPLKGYISFLVFLKAMCSRILGLKMVSFLQNNDFSPKISVESKFSKLISPHQNF